VWYPVGWRYIAYLTYDLSVLRAICRTPLDKK
jgi:hypothetical protein